MDRHTHRAFERLEVVERGRRRRWSDEEKLKIVLESLEGPRLVAAAARRHGISRSQLVTWRRAFRVEPPRSAKTPTFVPAIIEPTPAEPEPQPVGPRPEARATTSRMEIVLACGRRIVVGADVDGEALARVVAVLERR
ncbi:IS66-like element accessory protein TnpA [Acuticoccus yangtzensis]|uniref:IS66-like element accessory protein TnpA n=1 Tax=Acuticoccus yangtzensis TaxID=1443441 RepID=UPI0009499F92|nr:transposase [Acuticoccus yangtzensis]